MLVDRIKSYMSNNGGWNHRRSRFAGNIPSAVSAEERLAVLHSLIFPNGVRKTTDQSRNTPILRSLLAGRLRALQEVSVIDVGCSSGADALGTVEMIREQTHVARYVLADLHTSIIVDSSRKRVYSEDGDLLQIGLGPAGFFCTNFSYNFDWQRPFALPERALAKFLTTAHQRQRADGEIVSLADPRLLHLGHLRSPFEQLRFDVFNSEIDSTFDVVVCLHLLVARYFSEKQIQSGIQNLKRLVRPGGLLVCGDKETPLFLQKDVEGNRFHKVELQSSR